MKKIIFVTVPPKVISSKVLYENKAGLDVQLQSRVTTIFPCIKEAKVFWQRTDGNDWTKVEQTNNSVKYLGSTVINPSLTIKNITNKDAGIYRCGATTSVGRTGYGPDVTLKVDTCSGK